MSQRVIFFDIDGTLLASGGAGQKAMELALTEEFRISFPFEGVLTAGRTDFGIVTEIFDRYDIAHTDEERSRFQQAYLERLPHCLESLDGLLLPGIVELLQTLSGRPELVLALLTGNYSEGAWIKLRHFQLDHHFEFGGFGDRHANRDDVASAACEAAQKVLNRPISGRNCCVVGDTPADIQCARSIDADIVAVATGAYSAEELKPHEPDHLFVDLSDTRAAAAAIAG